MPVVEPQNASIVRLTVQCDDPSQRRGEPLCCGLPFPQGSCFDTRELSLATEDGQPLLLQATPLSRWPDGSIRWALLRWRGTICQRATYVLSINRNLSSAVPSPSIDEKPAPISTHNNSKTAAGFTVQAGDTEFRIPSSGELQIQATRLDKQGQQTQFQIEFNVELASDIQLSSGIEQLTVIEQGPINTVLRIRGGLLDEHHLKQAEFDCTLEILTDDPIIRFAWTIRNHRRAKHTGNQWDLGDEGSLLIREAAVQVSSSQRADLVHCSAEPGLPAIQSGDRIELYQDSSGGANWNSLNHVNRQRRVPATFSGYRLRVAETEQAGSRATPTAYGTVQDQTLMAVACQHFWQNCPQALTIEPDKVRLSFLPSQYGDLHELQGGEQKTYRSCVALGNDPVTDQPLDWVRTPAIARAEPSWYCDSQVLAYLTPSAADSNSDYLQLVNAAIDGADTFLAKREVIDQYGWRHFGEIYGDHEAARQKDGPPLISHYNNQYDAVGGMICQYLRSGDRRWWAMAEELAWHVVDIDIYHTNEDKPAYNHGLFWHTYHYVDADTGTHRSYPKVARLCGGGPSAEHVYATGLMLHYFMTGDVASREAVVDFANWVIDIDDGNQTVFRWLSRGHTGLASSSGVPTYHGPGRGSANAVSVLLDGYKLTGEVRYLQKAEQLIRRVVHPLQDIAALDLLDAERKWFYTMFLQSLGKYLDLKIEYQQLDEMYSYAQQVLLNYAAWMSENEYPYLSKPERLEYPTETWAAQDMRKSEVFKYAMKHASEPARSRLWERAEYFFRYSTSALKEMPTRTYCRPVVLLLSFGWMHAYFQRHPQIAAPISPVAHSATTPLRFVPQKIVAKKRVKVIAAGLAAAGVVAIAATVYYLL